MAQPTLRQIQYFIATANTGQISLAAIDMNVSQSAITAAIKSLENIVGTSLFERSSLGMSLTYKGHLFLDHANQIIAMVDEAVSLPAQISESVKGELRLAANYTVSGYFITPYLAQFNRYFPEVKVLLTETTAAEIEEGLNTGKFDIAVMITSNIADQEGVSYDTLLHSKRRLWVGTHHPFLGRTNVSLQDISTQPYIMLTFDEASNSTLRYWNMTPYRPNTMFRTASIEALRSMVANEIGVAILSDIEYRPWSLEGRRVETIEVSDEIPTLDIGIAWSTSTEFDTVTEAFVKLMRMAVRPKASLNLQ